MNGDISTRQAGPNENDTTRKAYDCASRWYDLTRLHLASQAIGVAAECLDSSLESESA